MTALKLGLLGAGIGRSRAPLLHKLAGRLCGIDVCYDLIDLHAAPADAFEAALEDCRANGYRGVNVTHPFKERATHGIRFASEPVRHLGAVNTLCFDAPAQPLGFNTDYTGFRAAFAERFPGHSPGVVAIVGAGGVARAIAFALADLGAAELRLFDAVARKCGSLAAALRAQAQTQVNICHSLRDAIAGADGIVNATPIGMHHHPGTPVPRELVRGQSWAFDAVYTPTDTCFLRDASDAGIEVLSGYELFFQQGVHAFEVFSGVQVDAQRLREALADAREESI